MVSFILLKAIRKNEMLQAIVNFNQEETGDQNKVHLQDFLTFHSF